MRDNKPLNGPKFEPSDNPDKLVFLLHGYGDNGENFIPLAKNLHDPKFNVNFFAPNAPSIVPQYPLGRQWFNPYPNGIHYNEVGTEEKIIMQQECEISIKLLKAYINKLCLLHNLSHQDCFLIGFSQGAMIAFELGNFMRRAFSGCVMLSGRILLSHSFDDNLFINTPLMIVHGDSDDVVNPKYFAEAYQIVKSNGFTAEKYLMKEEGHTISSKTLQLVQNFIKKYM